MSHIFRTLINYEIQVVQLLRFQEDQYNDLNFDPSEDDPQTSGSIGNIYGHLSETQNSMDIDDDPGLKITFSSSSEDIEKYYAGCHRFVGDDHGESLLLHAKPIITICTFFLFVCLFTF